MGERLQIAPNDSVLEVGFGPGVVIKRLSDLASAGHIAGLDPSPEMVEQARARNIIAIRSGRVDLQRGSVENLPFGGDSFDKALAINSMQVWLDAVVGLKENPAGDEIRGQRSRWALRAIPADRKKD